MMHYNPLTAIDFYKANNIRQYPDGVSEVYSTLTTENDKLSTVIREYFDHKIVFFGLQYFLKNFLINAWNSEFFNVPKDKIIAKYKRRMDFVLGKDLVETKHIEELHDLGYLPIKIKAFAEGARIPIGVPILTIVNTHPSFFWLTNYIETILLSCLWKPITSATTAFEYKKLLTAYAKKTGSPVDFVNLQSSDFSFRGMSGLEDAAINGLAHLTSFFRTSTVPAIDCAEEYYGANVEQEMVGCSIPSTEHSVMSMGLQEGELATFKRLINEIYPTGIVSIVSDTWDFWKVVTEYMTILKDDILQRDGKVAIRPDSGDPVKIIVGDKQAPKDSPEYKGALGCLWDIFGGTINSQGYKILDEHIGVIYGDSITLRRAQAILAAMEEQGYASVNIIFGVGSFTYQYVTRDSFGFAVKATSGVVNGERRDIFKDPITDKGIKKSSKGLLRIELEDGEYVLYDRQTEEQEKQGILQTIFENSKILKTTTLQEIRSRLEQEI